MTEPKVTDHAFVRTAWTRNCAHLADLRSERCGLPPEQHYGVPPPWWRWFEPPRWFPKWLHLLTCSFCRGWKRYLREQKRLERRSKASTPAA